MDDGWVGILAERGYTTVHRKSLKEQPSYRKDFKMIEVGFIKDGEEVLTLDQQFHKKHDKCSLSMIYREGCIRLGIYDPFTEPEPMPVDLSITEQYPRSGDVVTTYKHPSFGSIKLFKYTGRVKQFMSPVDTHGGMRIEICTAELQQHDGSDHVYSRELILDLHMSHTQFAEFITSAGDGSGTPITIRSFDGASIQPIELPTYMERLVEERKDRMREAKEGLHALMEELAPIMTGTGPLAAGMKKDVWGKMQLLIRELDSTPEFIIDQMKEHLDMAMVHGKNEIATWAKERINLMAKQRLQDITDHGGDHLMLPADTNNGGTDA